MEYTPKRVIVTSADDNYMRPLATLLVSISLHCEEGEEYDVYVLDGGLTEKTKRTIASFFQGSALTIHWCQVPLDRLDSFKVTGHVSVATYFRFLIPEIVPQEVERVLYLDCDIVCEKSLAPLWDISFGDHLFAAAQDLFVQTVSSGMGLLNYAELGLEPELPYFNAGFLMFNLERCRKENILQTASDYNRTNAEHVRWWDQDILNALYTKRWVQLPQEWNAMVTPNSEESIADPTYKSAAVIHYATERKPWHLDYNHPAGERYYYYLDKTPWRGWRPKLPWKQRLKQLLSGKL